MATTLSADVMQDELAMSLAQVIAAANRTAREAGRKLEDCLVTITQHTESARPFWRVAYGPRDYVGRRGGDLIVDVDEDGKVREVLLGQ